MITPVQIYLISTADDISVTFIFFFALTTIALIASGVYWIGCITDDDGLDKIKAAKKRVIILSVITFIFGIFVSIIPSTRALIAMYTIPAIVNNKEVQKLPENLLKFANDYLEKENKKEDKR
jgi:hypothetical protein